MFEIVMGIDDFLIQLVKYWILYRYYNLARSVYEKLYDKDPECEGYQTLLARIVQELKNLDMSMNSFERSRDELE